MSKTLLILISIFILFSNGQINAQKIKISSPEIRRLKSDGNGIGKYEPSAIEVINNNYFLVADDDSAELLVVERNTGEVSKIKQKGENFPKDNPKWEAMAKDDDYFYVVGAHENYILRFKIDDSDSFKINEDVRLNFTNGSLPAGYKIEGLAVRNLKCGRRLIIGLREKYNEKGHIQTYFADLKDDAQRNLEFIKYFDFNAEKTKKIKEKEEFPFHLSSLEYIPTLEGFLIITSTEQEPDNIFFGNALWFMSDKEIEKRSYKPVRIEVNNNNQDFMPNMKAEGVCLIPVNGNKYQLAIVFDNDGIADKVTRKRVNSELYFYDLTVAP